MYIYIFLENNIKGGKMNNLKMTSLDLLYLEDMFNFNMTLYKKVILYENNIKDPDLYNKLESIKLLHNNICNEVIKIIKGVYNGG